MKHTFNTPELRQTASGIKTAVAPKSVTPEMVGGTLLDLVDAQGEVIEALAELGRETVTVRVNAYDGSQRVSTTNAKVYVDIFSVGGIPTVALPRQELAVDENGEVTFEVYKGYKFAVFSKLDGMGASFQFTYTAGQDERTIDLWNFPVGVFMVGYSGIYIEETELYRCVPYIAENYISDWDEMMEYAAWDIQDGENCEDCGYYGVLVSSAESSFVLSQRGRSENTMKWSERADYGYFVPTMPIIDSWVNDYDEMVALARADYNGNLNTAKIIAGCNFPLAAEFSVNINEWAYGQHFLPSAGQLYLVYLNKAAINALMTAANDDGYEYVLIDTQWYWSSTQANEFCARYVYMGNGSTGNSNKNDNNYVLAVSAFHFIY